MIFLILYISVAKGNVTGYAPSSSGLGHWPFTPKARVQIPLGAPENEWVLSSAGRASALQAEGRRFDPCSTHHFIRWPGSSVGRALD